MARREWAQSRWSTCCISGFNTFLSRYEFEALPEAWRTLINKVMAPRLIEEPLEPVELLDDQRIANSCDTSFLGQYDKASQ